MFKIYIYFLYKNEKNSSHKMEISQSGAYARISSLIAVISFIIIMLPGNLVFAQETIDVGKTGWDVPGENLETTLRKQWNHMAIQLFFAATATGHMVRVWFQHTTFHHHLMK
jgi:hypothetical protein